MSTARSLVSRLARRAPDLNGKRQCQRPTNRERERQICSTTILCQMTKYTHTNVHKGRDVCIMGKTKTNTKMKPKNTTKDLCIFNANTSTKMATYIILLCILLCILCTVQYVYCYSYSLYVHIYISKAIEKIVSSVIVMISSSC